MKTAHMNFVLIRKERCKRDDNNMRTAEKTIFYQFVSTSDHHTFSRMYQPNKRRQQLERLEEKPLK